MSSVQIEPQDLPDPAAANHGMTVAAWVLNIGLVVGAIIIGVGMMVQVQALTWGGVAVCAISLIAGAVLRALGYGQPLK